MKILFLEWNSFCNEDMIKAFEKKGHTVIRVPFDGKIQTEEQNKIFSQILNKTVCDFLFSFNYYPQVSEYCMQRGVKYVSWVYDSPYINLYSYTVINPCNYVFVFDYAVFEEMRNENINTVYYLPMAVNPQRLSSFVNNTAMKKKHSCDVSMVGSLYTEKKHNLYDKFARIDAYVKGYLDGIINAQMQIYGCNFLQKLLTSDILKELEKAYPTDPEALTVASPAYIYAEYVLNRRVTALERKQIIEQLSAICNFHLYTHEKTLKIGSSMNMGPVDYYDEMPYVFLNSKINLNVSLRSIHTGIPLRAMDIMGCGGFLLTNYQAEFFEHFEEDKDFVFYSGMEDLMDKVTFYLKYDAERQMIAENGRSKVYLNHTFEQRVEEIISTIKS